MTLENQQLAIFRNKGFVYIELLLITISDIYVQWGKV